MTQRTFASLVLAYALVAVVTFGHAWHDIAVTPGSDDGLKVLQRASGAGFVSCAWPLYWSVQIFKWARNDDA